MLVQTKEELSHQSPSEKKEFSGPVPLLFKVLSALGEASLEEFQLKSPPLIMLAEPRVSASIRMILASVAQTFPSPLLLSDLR